MQPPFSSPQVVSTVTSAGAIKQPLIEVVGIGNKLVLDNVYLNSLHALRRLEIRNISSTPVIVKMRSNLGSQIAFQLTNENLLDRESRPSRSIQNNTSGISALASVSVASAISPGPESLLHDSGIHQTSSPIRSGRPSSTSLGQNPAHTKDIYEPSHLNTGHNFPLLISMDSLSYTNDSSDSPMLSTQRSSFSASSEYIETSLSQNHPLQSFTSNTVEAAAMSLSGFGHASEYGHGHQFNQLFNYVNHIDEVLIEPGQLQKIIIAFLPEIKDSRESVLTAQAPANSRLKSITGNRLNSSQMMDSLFVSQGEEEETFDFFEVNGLIFFFAYRADSKNVGNTVNPPTNTSISTMDNVNGQTYQNNLTVNRKLKSVQSSTNQQLDSLVQKPVTVSDAKTRSIDTIGQSKGTLDKESSTEISPDEGLDNPNILSATGGDSSSNVPDFQLTIKLRSRVCRSLLWTDISSTGLIFDNCIVGGSYFKDFTVWNRSEIDLFWCLNTVDLSNRNGKNWLRFTDYNTGDPVENASVPAYSHQRIRVTFKPHETGEFNYDLQIENQNDSENMIETRIHAIVHDVLREEALFVSTGSMIDFGDCCAGLWRKRRITLKNMSNSTLDISFESDNPGVVFQLKSDDPIVDNIQSSPQQHNYTGHHHHLNHHRQKSANPSTGVGSIQYTTAAQGFSQIDGASPCIERPRVERMQDISAVISGTNSDLSPTQSSTSSHASSPLLPPKRNNSTTLNMSGAASGASLGSTNAAGSGGGSLLTEPIGLARTSSSNSSFEKNDEVNNLCILDLPQIDALGVTTEDVIRIDEVQLRSGTERTIEICYKPALDAATPDYRAGKLIKRNFRITLMYAHPSQQTREKKTIQAVARTCTSFIEVTPQLLNFGDTDVNTFKSLPIQITNCSELPARVELRFVSKVLNSFRGEMTIHARQHIEVKIDIYPRKINPDYCKQITVVNLLNRENDHIVDVRSTNIDKHRVTFHSLFYHILTPTSTNFVDFGAVVLNSPVVRTFTIENISKKVLSLQITSSMPDDIRIFTKSVESVGKFDSISSASSALERREKLLETLHDARKFKRPASDALSGSSNAGNITSSSLGLANITKSSRGAGDAQSSLTCPDDKQTPDYLDLASLMDGPGRRSPKRRPPQITQTAQLKLLRQHYSRERKSLFHEEESNLRPPLNRMLVHMASAGDDVFTPSVNTSGGIHKNSRLAVAADSSEVPIGSSMADSMADDPSFLLDDVLAMQFTDLLDGTKVTLDVLLLLLDKGTGVPPPPFPRASLEEKYARSQLMLRRELENAIQEERLVATSVVNIQPESSATIVLVLTALGNTRPHVQGKPRKHDARLFLSLKEFDRDIKQPQFEQLLHGPLDAIPVQELMLRTLLYRSIMELGQKNINFGLLDKNERRNKSIVIRNNSEAPLLYTIRKSGSIASGDILLDNYRTGLVRGYGKREVEFIFDPSLAGIFQEKLIVENIHDRENDQTMILKANIRQPENFAIEKLLLNFGVCMINDQHVHAQEFTVSNTSQTHVRTFEIRVDSKELVFERCCVEIEFELIDDDDNDANSGYKDSTAGFHMHQKLKKRPVKILSSEIEELIEQAEQKLKIAKRKGRKDKILKITEKLDKLRAGEILDEYATDKDDKKLKKEAIAAASVDSSPSVTLAGSTDLKIDSAPRSSADSIISVAGLKPAPTPLKSNSTSSPQPTNIIIPALANTIKSTTANATPTGLTVEGALHTVPTFKVKKSKYSIIFTIEPRCIKSVRVLLKAVEKSPSIKKNVASQAVPLLKMLTSPLIQPESPAESKCRTLSMASFADSDVDMLVSTSAASYQESSPLTVDAVAPDTFSEICTARIYVHEQKNTDIVKRILCKTTVCFDLATYQQKIEEENNLKISEAGLADQKLVPVSVLSDLGENDPPTVTAFRQTTSPLTALTTVPPNVLSELSPNFSRVLSSRERQEPAIENPLVDFESPIATLSETGDVSTATDSSIIPQIDSTLPSETANALCNTALGSCNTSDLQSTSVFTSQPCLEQDIQKTRPVQLPISILVEAPFVDLGKLEIGERKDVYATLTNTADTEVRFSFTEGPDGSSDLRFQTAEQVLKPLETGRFDLTIIPTNRGFFVNTMAVKDSVTDQKLVVVFVYYGIQSSYLRFHTFGCSSVNTSVTATELDFGNCYVDPTRKYATIQPLEIENIADHDLNISASSNLAQQCFIFSDEALSRPAVDILMEPKKIRTLYIALQPNLSGGSSTNQQQTKTPERSASSSPTGLFREMASRISSQIDCRTLIGGIKFVVQIRDTMVNKYTLLATKSIPTANGVMTLTTQTLKFTATIGQSLLMVSHNLVNFGVSTTAGVQHTGSFWIYNLSPRLPLEYELQTTSLNLGLSKVRGYIDGVSYVSQTAMSPELTTPVASLSKPFDSLALSPSSDPSLLTGEMLSPVLQAPLNSTTLNVPQCDRIDFTLSTTEPGFIHEAIDVININNSMQQTRVEIRLFVDPILLSLSGVIWLPPLGAKDLGFTSEAQLKTESRPAVKWDNIYVISGGAVTDPNKNFANSLVLQNKYRIDSVPLYERSFEVENLSRELLQIQPISSMDINVRWVVPNGCGFVVEGPTTFEIESDCESTTMRVIAERLSMAVCGATLLLHPGEKATLVMSAPRPKLVYEGDFWNAIMAGHKVVQDGVLLLQNVDRGSTMKIVELSAEYCISTGEVAPVSIDLGKVGHFNMWKEMPFSFTIGNTSHCPMQYELEIPDVIDIISISNETDLGVFKRRIDPGMSHTVDAVLKPRNIDPPTPGLRNFPINIINVYNPRNVSICNVSAFLTQFELRFDRLVAGQLDLPTLIHPTPPNALPCDNWFTIINITDEDVKFEVGCTLAPDVADLVEIAILSRFSNSPLVGSLSLAPRGTTEIKVRASALPKSKLTANESTSKYLTNVDGITLGTLWITSKNQVSNSTAQPLDADVSIVSPTSLAATPASANIRMTETIPIRGTIIEGSTFILSHRRIEFQCVMPSDSELENGEELSEAKMMHTPSPLRVQHKDVVITNVSSDFNLEFKIVIETPIELASTTDKIKVHPLDSAMCGRVEPGGTFVLRIELLDPKIGGVSEDVKLHVLDINSLSKQVQTIFISIVEDTFGALKVSEDNNNVSHPPAGLFEPFISPDRTAIDNIRGETNNSSVRWDDDYNFASGGVGNTMNYTGAGGSNSGASVRAVTPGIMSSTSTTVSSYAHMASEDDDIPFSDTRSGASFGPNIGSTSSRHMSTVDSIVNSSGRRATGHIVLRGCKKVADAISGDFEGLYELDLGQQDLGQTPISKKIVIENTSNSKVFYRLGSITENDRSWLVCSCSEGVLDAFRSTSASSSLSASHTITLNIMVSLRGVFSTYLLVENVDNRYDTKIIRVSVEVVAKSNVRRSAVSVAGMASNSSNSRIMQLEPNNNHAFDVFTQGLDWDDSSLEISPVYLGCLYSSHSLVICNRESVPLEFLFKSNLTYDDDSEMLFSLSPTSVKLFRSLTIEPESCSRVCVRFWPGQSMPCDKEAYSTSIENTSKSLEEQGAVEKIVEIYINCRLVKDYQKTITFCAMLCQPQIMLSQSVFLFSGMIRSKKTAALGADLTHDSTIQSHHISTSPNIIQFSPVDDTFSVTNLLHDTLEYEILTDGMYFTIELVNALSTSDDTQVGEDKLGCVGSTLSLIGGTGLSNKGMICPQPVGSFRPLWTSTGVLTLGPMQSQKLRIVPLMDILVKNTDALKKEKYVLEHMILYNKRRPSEKYGIHVKLSFGNVEMFHFASGSRRSFFNLESHIVRLSHELEAMPSMYFTGCNLTQESAEKASAVHFLYLYVIDELIHYGTRDQGAEMYLPLATLLFTMIFSQSLFKEYAPASLVEVPNSDIRVWPKKLLKWVKPFTVFMGHFPHRLIAMEPLRMLARSLVLDYRKASVSSSNVTTTGSGGVSLTPSTLMPSSGQAVLPTLQLYSHKTEH
ncbi:hypothetical protein BDV3_000767 [Batrachochytrium dendrobatidis]|uniref:Uncharacterized protein n=1 Tax=Batrachochytrium dendrobatidis (strain JEL423) TaxID=403673 RepID=A0A177W924_BATDL|nr:hypothetical protein BDEG_20327 [Batrachochytrium dendrobatidis JEL423]OAJ36120.1 hypothetical protein, variant [Batrachochytrium dendrobatidis JEL423]